jgi:hypothetical protein
MFLIVLTILKRTFFGSYRPKKTKNPFKKYKISPIFTPQNIQKRLQALQKIPQKMLQGKFCQVWEYFCITVLTRLKATEKNANF